MLFSALREIHSKEIVHRDIKPANIFRKRNFDIVLGDFGICLNPNVLESLELDQNEFMIGTPNYIAPELHDVI